MPTPLSQDEINEYIRLKGFDPAEADLDMFTGEVKPKQKAQPALSTPEAPAPSKKETFWRSTALSVLPSAASLPVGAAVGMKAAAATAPLATVPFVGPAIPVVAGLSAGLLAGGLASAGASQMQQKVLEQSEGGQKFLERAALARETNPITSAVGDVLGSLSVARPSPKMMKDAFHALTTERAAGAGLLNKLANPAVQEIGISGALGGGMSAYEDIQEGKDVNVGKALVNTALQGLVSNVHPFVANNVPGLRGTSYAGLPGAEPAAETFIPNRVATPVEPSPADVAAIANERAGLEVKLKGVEDSLKSVVDEAKREQIQREAKIALAELELKNRELAAREQALREKVTFEASPENVEWAKQMAIAKGADEFVAEPTGVLDATSGKTYGAMSVSPEGKRSIRASTTAAEESAKGEISTTLPEGLIRDQEGTAIGPRASTLVHENLHNDFLNMIQSDRAAQRKMGTQILDAVDKSPEFAEWKSKQTAENLSRMPDPREEFFAIEASKQFLRDPENKGRTWRGERAALKNLQTGKGGLQDAVQIGLMKFRYDRGLNANLTNVAKAAGAKASLASDVQSEIARREKNPEMEQMEFRKTAQEGTPLSKYLRDNQELPEGTFLPKKGQMEMRLSQPAREAKLGPSESLLFTTEDSPLKKKFFTKYPLLKEVDPNAWPKKYLTELYGVDARRIDEFAQKREQATGKPVDWKEVIEGNLYDPNRYPKMERVAGKSQAVRDEEGELVMRDRPTKEVVTEFTPDIIRVVKKGVDRAVEPLPKAGHGVRFAMLRALENPENGRYGGDKDYREMLLSRVLQNIHRTGVDKEGKATANKNVFMTAAREAQRLMRADFMELRRKKEAAKREAGVMEEVAPVAPAKVRDVDVVEDIKKQLQENYRKFDSDQIDDDTYETTLASLETKLKDAGLSRDEILDIVSDAETPAEVVKPVVTKVTPNPEAVRRRNIEPDGRIYQRGELVIPTVEIANSFKPKIAEYDRKIAILEGLKKANPNANVTEIRNLGYKNDMVIESDSRITSWDEAIREIKNRKADTTQYIKDIEEAAKLFKTETSATPAKKTNTVAQTRETVKELLAKGIIDKDEAAQLNRELAGMKDSDTVNLPELIADIRRGGADEVQYQPDEDRYSLPAQRETLTDEKDIFVTDAQKQFESGRPYGLQTSKDGKFASSDILAKLRNTPKVEQELLGKDFTDWLTVRSRVSPEEVKEWLEKNGPKVEVHNYGMEGKVSEAKREYDRMTHEFDSDPALQMITELRGEGNSWKEVDEILQKNYGRGDISTKAYNLLNDENIKSKVDRYNNLKTQVEAERASKDTPRATSAYDTVSAFDTNQPMPDWTASKSRKNVQRVDVVLPNTLTKNAREEIGFSTKAGREQIPLWQPDNLHENLPNTLGWAMIQYKDGPNGEKIAVIVEAQSRWGQEMRKLDGRYKKWLAEKDMPDTPERKQFWMSEIAEQKDHPLLRDYNRLILKAAIDQARKEGATHIMVSDAETAMMTEKLDTYASRKKGSANSEEEAIAQASRDGLSVDQIDIVEREKGEWIWEAKEREIERLKGFQHNYDTILPKIAEDLTGTEGTRVSLGEHKNAFFEREGNERGIKVKRSNLIFRNPDGTPKTDVSGLLYDISVPASRRESGEKFTFGGRRFSTPGERVTESPEFKKWFGDSKVVDKDGNPKVMYHGTPSSFTTFSGRTGSAKVHFFAADPERAGFEATRDTKIGANIIPAFLSIKNPYIIENSSTLSALNFETEFVQSLKDKGFDGVMNKSGTTVAAFYPTQIKSATGNRGTFDPTNPDIRFSSPTSRETLSPRATEEDRMKKGFIEAFAPQFDKVPDKQVSEAMKNMDTQRSMYLGAWHYAPIKEFQSKFKHMPEDRLNVIYDRVLETYRKGKKDLITEGLSSQEIKAANFLNDNVYRAARGKQQEIGMKVETREGLRREAKLSPWYVPEMLNDKALQAFTKGDQSATAQRYIDMWADHVVDQSAGTVTKLEALEEIRNYVAAIGEGGRRGTEFGALRKAAGYGLPKELRERNLLRVTQRYSRRAAQDVARFQHLELPEYVRNKLALPDPDTGVVHTQDSILHIEDVRQAMKFVNNSFEIYHNPRVASFARLVTNGILGPLTGIRDFMSIPVNVLPYVKATDIGTIFTSLLDARRDWQKSLKTGARTGMNQLDAVDTIPNLDKTTYAFNVASEMLRKYQGRDAIEQVNRVWTYSIGKNLAERAVLEKNKAFLEKFGRLAKDEATGKYNTDIMAKNFVDRVQGTYGGAGLPSSSVDGMAAPWFALARWSLEKSNVIWQDVIQPAYRKNNPQYGPLLRYALGAYLTGEAIDLLVEEINSGKKSNTPTYAELQAADADPESYVAKLVNVMQLGSFAGMAGDVAKMAMDAYRGEKPQGFSVPAATLISQGIGDTVVNFSRAVRDGTDPLDAAGILILELMKNQVQTARLALNAADNEDVDRKNALRDLRLYKQMRGEILPSDFQRANPAMRPEEREFKRAKTEEEAGASLNNIITNLQEEFKNDPRGLRKALDRLKKNSYQTFPNLELDPAGATEYYQYLIQSLGPVEAKKRLDDYIKQTSLNKAKTAAIP